MGGLTGRTRALARAVTPDVVRRAARKALWLARKVAYYLLPPVVHDTLKSRGRALAPRVLQKDTRSRLTTALRRRLNPGENPAGPVPGPDPHANFARYHAIYVVPEDNPEQIAPKLLHYRALVTDNRLDRVRLYREIGRLERATGDEVKGCVYALRAMRLIGRDEFGDLAWVRPTLEKAGYGPEAEAAAALYSVRQDAERDAACARLIEAAEAKLRRPPALPADYTIFDDRRGSSTPRVSVLITLYNGADKLAAFLRALQLQTLNRAGGMELVVVDSCSPQDEYAAFRKVALDFPIPTLFARTAARETIQTAWNRAIGLARAPYLSFLGVDETITPDTLAVLADELDADPATDWAQGDVLVTEVDRNGAVARDIMPYDRTPGFFQDLVYLETCYLGPVGAAHRKAMHDRVGYFDGSYRGAGDTEFKNRVLPRTRVKPVPRMLGLYLNYPEERTTASPRAELEDFRAWYLHRSPAGIRHAFRGRPDDLERIAVAALRYRKSYLRHWSSDFEFADTAFAVLREMKPDSPALAYAPGAARALAAVRLLDRIPSVKPDVWAKAVRGAYRTLAEVQDAFRRLGLADDLVYDPFHDNRHEQHTHLW